MGKKGDLSDFERGRFVGARRAGLRWTIEDWKNVFWSDESRFLLTFR